MAFPGVISSRNTMVHPGARRSRTSRAPVHVRRTRKADMRGIRSAAPRGVLALALALGLAPAAARAQQTPAGDQPIPAALFKGLTWRSVGPARGGRSIAVGGSA